MFIEAEFAFNEGGNDGFWRFQLRDKHGRWVKMGGPCSFEYRIPGDKNVYKAHGTFEGNRSRGFSVIRVGEGEPLSPGDYEIDSRFIERVDAIIRTKKAIAKDKDKPKKIDEALTEETKTKQVVSSTVGDLEVGDIVQQSTAEGLYGRIASVEHGDKETKLNVEWSDGSAFDMNLPKDQKIKVWNRDNIIPPGEEELQKRADAAKARVDVVKQQMETVDVPKQTGEAAGPRRFLELFDEERVPSESQRSQGVLDNILDSDITPEEIALLDPGYARLSDEMRSDKEMTMDFARDVVSDLYRRWNGSSTSDHTIKALQQAAKDLYDLEDVSDVELTEQATDLLDRGRPVYEAFLEGLYAQTQKFFKDRGITEVEVYRGYKKWAGGDLPEPTEIKVDARAINSWSANLSTGFSFSGDGILMKTVVPVDRILSTPYTGMGVNNEREVVILGSPDSVFAVKSSEFESIQDFDTTLKSSGVDGPNNNEWEPVGAIASGKGESEWLDSRLNSDLFSMPPAESRHTAADEFSDEELAHIEDYTGTGFRVTNHALRNNENLSAVEQAKVSNLDAAIEELGDVTEPGLVVYRGHRLRSDVGDDLSAWVDDLVPGNIVSDPAFTSTSSDPVIAFHEFGPGIGGKKGSEVVTTGEFNYSTSFWKIDTPEGTKALPLPRSTGVTDENEVLFPRNAQLKIKAIRKVPQTDENGEENGRFNYFIDAELQPTFIEPETVDAPKVEVKAENPAAVPLEGTAVAYDHNGDEVTPGQSVTLYLFDDVTDGGAITIDAVYFGHTDRSIRLGDTSDASGDEPVVVYIDNYGPTKGILESGFYVVKASDLNTDENTSDWADEDDTPSELGSAQEFRKAVVFQPSDFTTMTDNQNTAVGMYQSFYFGGLREFITRNDGVDFSDVEILDKFVNPRSLLKGLTDEQKELLNKAQADLDNPETIQTYVQMMRELDTVIANSPGFRPGTKIYRGVDNFEGKEFIDIEAIKRGELTEIYDPSFLSTTANRGVGETFANKSVLFEIEPSEELTGLRIFRSMGMFAEEEILLPRGVTYEILGIDTKIVKKTTATLDNAEVEMHTIRVRAKLAGPPENPTVEEAPEETTPAFPEALNNETDVAKFWKTDKKNYELKAEVTENLRKAMLEAGITEEQLDELFDDLTKGDTDKNVDKLELGTWEGSIEAKEIGVFLNGSVVPVALPKALFQVGFVDISEYSGAGDNTLTMEEARALIAKMNDENEEIDEYYSHMELFADSHEAKKDAVSLLVGAWASTSNDDSPLSLAIQESIKSLFDMQMASEWAKTRSAETEVRAKELKKKYKDILEAFAQAQYDATQKYFRDRGITEVQVYRGVYGVQGSERPSDTKGQVMVKTRPISSWSTSQDIAEEFAEGKDAVLYTAVFPIENIFATPFTGVGCLSEEEFVMLGGLFEALAERLN